MMIIHRTEKTVESQSHRTENWMGADWAEVPEELQGAVLSAAPWCTLAFDTSGKLTGVTAEEKPQDTAQEEEKQKRQLSETDYKIIKTMEYSLAGLSAPYDIAALHQERQTIRNQINAVKAKQNV